MEKSITEMLRAIKAETGWSEPRMAAELNTSQPTVNRILRGQKECRASTYRSITELYSQLNSTRESADLAETGPRRRSTDLY